LLCGKNHEKKNRTTFNCSSRSLSSCLHHYGCKCGNVCNQYNCIPFSVAGQKRISKVRLCQKFSSCAFVFQCIVLDIGITTLKLKHSLLFFVVHMQTWLQLAKLWCYIYCI